MQKEVNTELIADLTDRTVAVGNESELRVAENKMDRGRREKERSRAVITYESSVVTKDSRQLPAA